MGSSRLYDFCIAYIARQDEGKDGFVRGVHIENAVFVEFRQWNMWDEVLPLTEQLEFPFQ
jgi:hypothetical protein